MSRLAKQLDKDLEAWRSRPLTQKYEYLVVDACYEKIRKNGRIVSKAVVIIIGITNEGIREVIGIDVINSESYEAWDEFISSLKNRGLLGVRYAVSDENKGLRKALSKHFQGVKLQRCQVHFLRNFLSKLSISDKKEGIFLLKEVFSAHTRERAQARLGELVEFLLSRGKEKVAHWVEENIEECLHVLDLPVEHRSKLKSTNMLERLNQEIKRRTRVVRIFPSDESCLRLVSALCQETSEFWSTILDGIFQKCDKEVK